MNGATPSLDASEIRVETRRGSQIVEEFTMSLGRGAIIGLVGESGAGKTTVGLALLGYAKPGTRIVSGSVVISGQPVPLDGRVRSVRGSLVSYVPQNPGRALNPSLRIVDCVSDLLRRHRPDAPAKDSAVAALKTVGLPVSEDFLRRYPHQLSGGQQQRVCIAMAIACDPSVIVLDEPATGLDVVTQDRILTALRRLRDERSVAMVYVTHDLAAVATIADEIAVMYAGRIVEHGPTAELLAAPKHPYTRGLLASTVDHKRRRALRPMAGHAAGIGDRGEGCAFAPRCSLCTDHCSQTVPELTAIGGGRSVRCFEWDQAERGAAPARPAASEIYARIQPPVLVVSGLAVSHGSGAMTNVVAADINFDVTPGSCVALVGESGSGKTTIARAIAGLHPPAAGQVLLEGTALAGKARRRSVEQRRRIQIVFQNPAEALNPRHTVRDSIARPIQVLRGASSADAHAAVTNLLERVRVPPRLADRYPGELSGGERQRVAIARALAAGPDVLLCDEITSALDVSVQAAVLEVLNELRQDSGLALLFITHDLGVVASVAEQILVLQEGRIVERGGTMTVLECPKHLYTRTLLAAAPSLTEIAEEHPPAPTVTAVDAG